MNEFDIGFSVDGPVSAKRQPVDWPVTFAECLGRPNCDTTSGERYLSLFTFGYQFHRLLDETRSTKGYDGPTWAPYLWFDIDRENDLDHALADARRLVDHLLTRFPSLTAESIFVFFSGSKGFHIGIPTSVVGGMPSHDFHTICKRFCVRLADDAGATIDGKIYDRVRLFRSPNSRHPKTGLYKRLLTLPELRTASASDIRRLCQQPKATIVPPFPQADPSAGELWQRCVLDDQQAVAVRTAKADKPVNRVNSGCANSSGHNARRATVGEPLSQVTLNLVNGEFRPADGTRNTSVFQAAANLTEFGTPAEVVRQLLTTPGRNTGLAPTELDRVIDNGIAHGKLNRAS